MCKTHMQFVWVCVFLMQEMSQTAIGFVLFYVDALDFIKGEMQFGF